MVYDETDEEEEVAMPSPGARQSPAAVPQQHRWVRATTPPPPPMPPPLAHEAPAAMQPLAWVREPSPSAMSSQREAGPADGGQRERAAHDAPFRTFRGIHLKDFPPDFVAAASAQLLANRAAQQFSKERFYDWLNNHTSEVMFAMQEHKKTLYNELRQQLRDEELANAPRPANYGKVITTVRNDLMESVLTVLLEDEYTSLEEFRDEVISDYRSYGIDYTRDDVDYAMWSWNAQNNNERPRAAGYLVLNQTWEDLRSTGFKYPYGTLDDARASVAALRTVPARDVEAVARYFVKLDPVRNTTTELEYESPQDVLDARAADEAESGKGAAMFAPSGKDVDLLHGVSKPMAAKRARDWKWSGKTRQHALDWVRANASEWVHGHGASLHREVIERNKALSAAFINECVSSQPEWVENYENKESACHLLLKHVITKLKNEQQDSRKRSKAVDTGAEGGASVMGTQGDAEFQRMAWLHIHPNL